MSLIKIFLIQLVFAGNKFTFVSLIMDIIMDINLSNNVLQKLDGFVKILKY